MIFVKIFQIFYSLTNSIFKEHTDTLSIVFRDLGDFVRESFDTVMPYLRFILAIIPQEPVAVIFNFTLTLYTVRVGIKLVKTLWQLIPLA